MSAPMATHIEATRRRLSGKQAETVDRLTKTAVQVLTRQGYAGTTMRLIAAEAGVGTATAYTYFSSKEHLIAEVYWRQLVATPPTDLPDADAATRAIAVLRQAAMLMADEPALAAAMSQALLGDDPDVAHLRLRIGGEIRSRLAEALGGENAEDLESLEMLYSGAMLQAGMVHLTYAEVADRLERSARRLLA
ncbi:TetR/AcrR family transcriptional regulator [Nocardia gipuzkoensis]|uniref:TetR/AcrR family transcriptional regulator n=1 Tax=Nocardia gipuzkoensis TaxID=2749991 RepID=UPI0015EFBC48|nr:TetR/AcrR family transcriptional regulator [Nocardia gipuzkoensis]